MPQITIRLLALPDLPAYKALRDEALRTAPEAFTSDYATEILKPHSAYSSRLGEAQSGHCMWGAFDEKGALLGSIALQKEARFQQQHCAHVVGMMVASAAQGHGIATQLIAACAYSARATDRLDQLILTVTASNLYVVRLYERAGFKPWGLLPRAIKVNGRYFDKLHMRLDLRLDVTAAASSLSE